jgi:phage baseplate assembly protein W
MGYAYTDLDLSLARQKDGDVQLLGDEGAIRVNLMNIVKTLQGSRRMRPDFAFGATNLLFEQMSDNTSRSLGNAVADSINAYEDRIDLSNVHVDANYQAKAYNVRLTYTLKEFGSQFQEYTLNFILKQL